MALFLRFSPRLVFNIKIFLDSSQVGEPITSHLLSPNFTASNQQAKVTGRQPTYLSRLDKGNQVIQAWLVLGTLRLFWHQE